MGNNELNLNLFFLHTLIQGKITLVIILQDIKREMNIDSYKNEVAFLHSI